MKISEDHRKLLKITSLYYEQGLTQAQIAKKMKISRPVISKMLQQAKDDKIVTVTIKDESAHTIRLALELEKKYNLSEVIVVPNGEAASSVKIQQKVGESAAAHLGTLLKPKMSIGLSWGTTLADMIDAMSFFSFPNINVCPLVGGVSSEHLYFDTNHLAFRLSEKLSSHCQYFYAPALSESVELADVLNKSQLLSKILSTAKSVDLAIVGVGNPNETSTWRKLGYFSSQEIEEIKNSGIKGDAVASLFDKNGETVNNEISQRMLGIKVEDLAEIPQVMIIGCGEEKSESIRSMLMGGYCSILVIDQLIAESLA